MSQRVLVADDKPGMREGCREVLLASGYEVDVAEDGLTALSLADQNEYDLLIVDVKMPGVGGLEVLRCAHERYPDTVCVVITGYATLELAVEATKLGAYDFLAKPFTPQELLSVVGKALEIRRLAIETRRLREERDRSLLEIASEKSRLRTIIECMQDGLLVTNREGVITLANQSADRLLNGEALPLTGERYAEAIGCRELVTAIDEVLADPSGGGTMRARELQLGKDGQTPVIANVAAILERSASGLEALGCVAVLHDVTRLKELEKVREQFVRMVAHELRAPVAAISQTLEAVLTDAVAGDAERQKRMLQRCQDRAGGLLSLVEDLLRVSAIDAGRSARNLEPVDVRGALTEAVDLFAAQARSRDIEIRTRLPSDLVPIRADRSDLGLVLTNLISNAIKYNRDGGWVEVSACASGQGVTIAVADSGIGIPDKQQSGLFNEFYRVQTPESARITGTGLGLSIVRRLVESNNGRVWLKSKYGEGSTFWVWLPSPRV